MSVHFEDVMMTADQMRSLKTDTPRHRLEAFHVEEVRMLFSEIIRHQMGGRTYFYNNNPMRLKRLPAGIEDLLDAQGFTATGERSSKGRLLSLRITWDA